MVSALAAVVTVHGSVERTFTYAIAQRGAIHADMHAFAAFVSRVYADPRGWSLGGRVAFRQVQTGADFTVWLASADEMASFGGGCSRQWDCRAGRDIVINQTRWFGGSLFWHGALDDYRTMILNHETGHWLGLDHQSCPAPGALAPVMMQQSKGTAACIPNPRPLQEEQARVARILDLATPP
ncbi:MAG: DUF3152 domain-containing protein [Candidatus Eremiobacteraeota bacterium]|nr:DUF3152 domain-containing protein [Candidatus Eremiobacteraeota bacterium]